MTHVPALSWRSRLLAECIIPECFLPPSMQGEDDGQSLLPVADYLAQRDGEKPIGVYALYDGRRDLQYVGYSRNMVLAVKVGISTQQIASLQSRV